MLLSLAILIGFLAGTTWLLGQLTMHAMDSFRHAFNH